MFISFWMICLLEKEDNSKSSLCPKFVVATWSRDAVEAFLATAKVIAAYNCELLIAGVTDLVAVPE
jgi:hypothetical protein